MLLQWLVLLLLAVVVAGCATPPRSITQEQAKAATVPGFAAVRVPLDASPAEYQRVFRPSKIERKRRLTFLALSGGGAGGAFGAGVLCGWTDRGDRPQFDIVSGVSTGALIAPFAFLGSDYDPVIRKIYTRGFGKRLIDQIDFMGLFGDGLIPQDKMRQMVRPFVDEALLARIAEEYRKGRRLVVLTTNLDSGRAIAWNMGAIAVTGGPRAVALFTAVLAASASVPVAMAPAFIQTVADGIPIEEMHVDGSTTQPILTIPQSLMVNDRGEWSGQTVDLYLVVNAKLEPPFKVVDGSVLDIASQAVATLIRSAEQAQVFATYNFAREHRFGYHLAAIGPDVEDRDFVDEFQTAFMQRLFENGYRRARSGTAFRTRPLPDAPPSRQAESRQPRLVSAE
ncbi:patatin-like phospholipase family protein [Consotaella salsifontis]|uniref:Patatin-like phospholipase n=1 Tax=Consotaella salsifontis TaxID=1365950 RepID=A0A1T4RK34_9HYPH|nr:patatin-like phospholipase family protein [Consotaella salsifontis]SKA16370.1 Patatin-like phospholipase [Consotaella salsifontis]